MNPESEPQSSQEGGCDSQSLKWHLVKLLQDRTALYLTAEKGSAETAQFLLDIGAPIGVYDSNGVSALACLIERIPNVAYRALEQYQTNNISLKQSRMYLSHLETDTTAKKGSCNLFFLCIRTMLRTPSLGRNLLALIKYIGGYMAQVSPGRYNKRVNSVRRADRPFLVHPGVP